MINLSSINQRLIKLIKIVCSELTIFLFFTNFHSDKYFQSNSKMHRCVGMHLFFFMECDGSRLINTAELNGVNGVGNNGETRKRRGWYHRDNSFVSSFAIKSTGDRDFNWDLHSRPIIHALLPWKMQKCSIKTLSFPFFFENIKLNESYFLIASICLHLSFKLNYLYFN